MPWFRVDDGFHGHPKVDMLSPAAVGIWTLCGSWSAQYLTDGRVFARTVAKFGGTDAEVQELVHSGLWLDNGDGSYQFKDWGDFIARMKGVGEKNAANFSAGGMTVNGAGYAGAPAKPAKDAKAKKEKTVAAAPAAGATPAAAGTTAAIPAIATKPAAPAMPAAPAAPAKPAAPAVKQ